MKPPLPVEGSFKCTQSVLSETLWRASARGEQGGCVSAQPRRGHGQRAVLSPLAPASPPPGTAYLPRLVKPASGLPGRALRRAGIAGQGKVGQGRGKGTPPPRLPPDSETPASLPRPGAPLPAGGSGPRPPAAGACRGTSWGPLPVAPHPTQTPGASSAVGIRTARGAHATLRAHLPGAHGWRRPSPGKRLAWCSTGEGRARKIPPAPATPSLPVALTLQIIKFSTPPCSRGSFYKRWARDASSRALLPARRASRPPPVRSRGRPAYLGLVLFQ